MQSARYFIGIIIGRIFKLTARMKLGHNHLSSWHTFFTVHANGNTAAIVGNRDTAIRIKRNRYLIAMPRQCFVNRIIRDFKNHMMKPAAIIRITNIHTRTFANSIKAFQDFDRIRAIVIFIGIIYGIGRSFFIARAGYCIGIGFAGSIRFSIIIFYIFGRILRYLCHNFIVKQL